MNVYEATIESMPFSKLVVWGSWALCVALEAPGSSGELQGTAGSSRERWGALGEPLEAPGMTHGTHGDPWKLLGILFG